MSRTIRKNKMHHHSSGLSKHLSIGPGGISCPCCAPPPGKRKEMFRSAKRKDYIEALKHENAS